ncbi:MAG TPA: hypothetical protein P5518_05870 [Candidatus Cloacimonas sp.]|jgi:hypothetical protein|nr:hypothetical protein [Candidatus Cloacimonas sp.]MDD2250700.1 hypothetical protein [Candidatus Cloacimonadota bacterium]MCK9158755.1 hypothetical protein [Candidatus Cloacimonas sp.]MCK9165511.1 hypothetical protein [Candidatus Cloacimonas sp.]MDD4677527.1 hypothetical protein [Candidatus Cloacimonadota bacterium]
MPKYLLPLCFFVLCANFLLSQESLALDSIATSIAEEIQIGQPIFLDINCGDWNPVLTEKLSSKLLEAGADLRYNLSDGKGAITFTEEGKAIDLSAFGLSEALLIQVNLNILWKEESKSSFFSYKTQRYPVHIFETRQIELPSQQLKKISTYSLPLPENKTSGTSSLHRHWFEPIVAGAAIGSLVFLLWNFD